MTVLHIQKPEAGKREIVRPEQGDTLELNPAELTPSRSGDDLVLTFDDDSVIVVVGYFATGADDRPALSFGPDGVADAAAPGAFAASMARLDHGQAAASVPPAMPGNVPSDETLVDAARKDAPGNSANPAGDSATTPQDTPQSSHPGDSSAPPRSQGQFSSDGPLFKETQFRSDDNLEFETGINRLPGLDLGWQRDEEPHWLLDGNGRDDAVLPTPNTGPLFGAMTGMDGLPLQFNVKETGVWGNDADLPAGSDANTAHPGFVTLQGLVHATDPDGDAMHYNLAPVTGGGISTGPQALDTTHGTVTIDASGQWTYTLDPALSQRLAQGETTQDSFVVQVGDGRGGTAEQLVKVTITGTNDAPVLDFASGNGEHVLSARPQGTDTAGATLGVTDPDSDGQLGGITGGDLNQNFSVTDSTHQSGTNVNGGTSITTDYGTLVIKPDGSYEYTMNQKPGSAVDNMPAGQDYADIFTVTVTDAHGSTDTRIITVHIHKGNVTPVVDSYVSQLNLQESGVADGGNIPVAGTGTAHGSVETHDQEGDTLTYYFGASIPTTEMETVAGKYGTLTLNTKTGAYDYTLNNDDPDTQGIKTGAQGTETFTLKVDDGHGGIISQTVTVTVEGSNDAPKLSLSKGQDAVSHELTDAANGPVQVRVDRGLTVDDPDSDGTLGQQTADSTPCQQFSIAQGADTAGTPTLNLDGSATFKTDYGTLTVDKNGNYTYKLDTSSARVDALGDTQFHTDQFIVQVTDSHGAVSETKTINVKITGKDDPPQLSFVQGDTDANKLVETGVAQGGADTNTPVPGKNEARGELTSEHTDGDATLDITFDLASTVGFSTTGSGALGMVTSGDGGRALTTDYGTLTLTDTSGSGKFGCTYKFVLNNNQNSVVDALKQGETVTLKFKVQANDDSGTRQEDLVITITGTNDQPIITSTGTENITPVMEDGAATTTGIVTAQDGDSDSSWNYSLVNATGSKVLILEGQYGRLEIIEGTGAYTYYLNNGKAQSWAAGETGHDDFSVRVTDDLGAYTEKTISIPITGQDDKPVLGNLGQRIVEDNDEHAASPVNPVPEVTGKVSATDVDVLDTDQAFKLDSSIDNPGASVDGTVPGQYTVVGQYGTLVFKADGSYTYTLNKNADAVIQELNAENSLTDSFTLTVNTGHTGHTGIADSSSNSPGTLVITIQGSNDNPVVTAFADLSVNPNPGSAGTVAIGQLTVTDVDDTVNQTATGTHGHIFYFRGEHGEVLQSVKGDFGVITVNQFTGQYTYTLNQYAPGLDTNPVEKNFTIVVQDNHGGMAEQAIKVNVAQLTGPPPVDPGKGYTLTGQALTVTEDAFAGTTNVQDTDTATVSQGTGPFGFNVGGHFTLTATGQYGTIIIDETSGQYTYTLNNALDAVQRLSADDPALKESFPLWGTSSHAIEVTISGANDKPALKVVDPTALTQQDGTAQSTSATATAIDIDSSDTHTFWLDAAGTSKKAFYKFTLDAQGKITGFTSQSVADLDTDYQVTIDDKGQYTLTYLAGGQHLTKDDTTTVSFDVYTKDDSGVNDGTAMSSAGTVNVTINGTNTAPVWGTLAEKGLTEDAFPGGVSTANITTTGSFLADGGVTDDTGNTANDGLTFRINGSATLLKGTYGTLLITDVRTGAYTYTLDNTSDAVQQLGVGETKTDSFTIRVTDKHGGSSDQTFSVTVTGTNDIPKLDALETLEIDATANSTSTGDISSTKVNPGHDVDTNDTLGYAFTYDKNDSANNGLDYKDYGTFKIDQVSGKYTFTLDNSLPAVQALTESQTVDLHFTVTVDDQHGGTATQPVVVTISGTNDAPVITAAKADELQHLTMDADGVLTGDFDQYAYDPDYVAGSTTHQPVSYTVETGSGQSGPGNTTMTGTYGTLSINGDGSYSYELTDKTTTPAGDDTFTLHVTDSEGLVTSTDITFVTSAYAPPPPNSPFSPRAAIFDDLSQPDALPGELTGWQVTRVTAEAEDGAGLLPSLLSRGESMDSLLTHFSGTGAADLRIVDDPWSARITDLDHSVERGEMEGEADASPSGSTAGQAFSLAASVPATVDFGADPEGNAGSMGEPFSSLILDMDVVAARIVLEQGQG